MGSIKGWGLLLCDAKHQPTSHPFSGVPKEASVRVWRARADAGISACKYKNLISTESQAACIKR